MGNAQPGFTKAGFTKAVVLPGLLIFLVPILTLVFFYYAQAKYDADALESILNQLETDQTLSPEERERAIAFFKANPYSTLIRIPEFAADAERSIVFDYLVFRSMRWLAWGSIASGVIVLVLAGVCVHFSRRSQQAQYRSLSIGWQVLRFYGALQTVVQGGMLVALSYWGTAVWFHIFIPKVVGGVGLMALLAAAAVIAAVFKEPRSDIDVEGTVIDRATAPRLYEDLQSICARVGADMPDQVVAGIDDNFFVTQLPVKVGGTTYEGRTLFVSLALLKQMSGGEADAVLAHEMAHFSGDDTLYSKSVFPLLVRWQNYLQALSENVLALPVFYFMNCFRTLFELTLNEHSRQREFRADKIAAESTSPRSFATGLLRIAAYSDYRNAVQQELYNHERPLAAADISSRIEAGFPAHAVSYSSKPDLGSVATPHPFDSHPPLAQRFAAVGIPLDSLEIRGLVAAGGDGAWYDKIAGAEQLEGQQWGKVEAQFRDFHERTLPYRLLPENDEERAIVVATFPEQRFEGHKAKLALNCERIRFSAWPDSIGYAEFTNCVADGRALHVTYTRDGKSKTAKLPWGPFGNAQSQVLATFNHYYGRYQSAAAYQKQKQAELNAGT